MFGQSLLSAFGIACTTDTDQLFDPVVTTKGTTATYQLNSNTDSLDIAGKFGGCGDFNGSSSGILVGSVGQTSALTISAWIYMTAHTANRVIASTYDYQSGPSKGYSFNVTSGGNLQFSVHNGDCNNPYPVDTNCNLYTRITSPGTVPLNQWVHVAVSMGSTGNALALYIDGASVVSTTTQQVGYYSVDTRIGYTTYQVFGTTYTEGFFKGKLDQIRFFSSALTASQISDLANETTSTASTLNYPTTATALYQLDGNATDTGGTYNGSSSNVGWVYNASSSGVTYSAGKFGNAATYSGSQADTGTKIYVDNGIYEGDTSVFSVSLWLKCTNTSGEIPISGNGGTIGGTTGYALYLENGKLSLTFRSSNGSQDFYGNTTYINDDVWHHLVLSFNNGPFVVYLDGAVSLSGTTTNFLNNQTPTYNTYFGNRWNRSENGVIAGQIDQIRIFGSTAIDQATVTALYNETTTTATYNYIDVDVYNSNAYYKMSNALDQFGNNNGTATNVDFNTEGKFGFAGGFGYSTSYMDVPISLTPPTSTLSLWFKTSTNDGDWTLLADAGGSSSSGTGYAIFRSGDGGYINLYFTNGQTGQSQLFVGTTVITDGNWHNLVLSMASDNTFVLYLDGTSHLSGTRTRWTQGDTSSVSYLRLGNNAASASSANQFTGAIDQVRTFNTALTAAQADTLNKEVYCQPDSIVGTNFFNTVLYAGNNSTNNITGVGFKPDFSWIKNRGDARSYSLIDSIRGFNGTSARVIQSESTNAEWDSQYINSFDTDGFTVSGTENYINNSSYNYVAWNWKGADYTYAGQFNGGAGSSGSAFELPTFGTVFQNNYSISAWFRCDAYGTAGSPGYNLATIVTTFTDYYGWVAVDNANSNKLRFYTEYLNQAPWGYSVYSTSTINKGQWYHMVATKSSTDGMKLYLDGVLQDTAAAATQDLREMASTPTYISAFGSYGSYPSYMYSILDGAVDQGRIYNTVLTASQVTELYEETASNNTTLNFPTGAGCQAAYTFDNTTNDVGGNYNATAYNVNYAKPGYLGGNTTGTIPAEVVANPNAGFSMIKYTGSGTSGSSIGHGLSTPPEIVFFKCTSHTGNWITSVTNVISNKHLYLNTNSTGGTGGFAIDATKITLNNTYGDSNTSGRTYMAYCFTSIPGYSRVSTYIGSGSSQPIYTGFTPRYVLIKCTTSSGEDWALFDASRGANTFLTLNTNGAEQAFSGFSFDSTGFTIPGSSGMTNGNGDTYLYVAIA